MQGTWVLRGNLNGRDTPGRKRARWDERVLTLLYLSFAKLNPSLSLARDSDGVVRDV